MKNGILNNNSSISKNENRDATKADEIERRCLMVEDAFRKNPSATITNVAMELGISKQKVECAVTRLQATGRLRHERPTKGGTWIVDI